MKVNLRGDKQMDERELKLENTDGVNFDFEEVE